MEEQKLVLQEGTYKYDDCTRQVSVSEDELRKAGYVKLADDETVVKKVELSEEEAEFVEENKYLPLFNPEPQDADFLSKANTYADVHTVSYMDECMMATRLIKSYFNGYTIKKEPKYYIKFPFSYRDKYLNVFNSGKWVVENKYQDFSSQTQFTQKEIDELQKDDRAKGLDLNALKVRVPNDELED